MAEYIEHEAFKKSVEERYCKPCKAEGKDHNGCWCRACWVDDMLDEVECFQPADVVPVVRCKDCKYSRPLNKSEKERFVEGVLMCTNSEVSEYGITDVWDTHFCSYGKRKDGGTNNV